MSNHCVDTSRYCLHVKIYLEMSKHILHFEHIDIFCMTEHCQNTETCLDTSRHCLDTSRQCLHTSKYCLDTLMIETEYYLER